MVVPGFADIIWHDCYFSSPCLFWFFLSTRIVLGVDTKNACLACAPEEQQDMYMAISPPGP